MMKKQSKGGLIYNMEGAGADGRPTADFAAYGATKRSLRQLNGSLQVLQLTLRGPSVHLPVPTCLLGQDACLATTCMRCRGAGTCQCLACLRMPL